MKARLLISQNTLYLLLCTGKIEIVTADAAREFLFNYDDLKYYSEPGVWDFEGLSMEAYKGKTIALVDDETVLRVYDSDLFRSILSKSEARLLTAPEYAALHGKKSAIVRRFCLEGRIKGAIQKGTRWLIPEDSPYPTEL